MPFEKLNIPMKPLKATPLFLSKVSKDAKEAFVEFNNIMIKLGLVGSARAERDLDIVRQQWAASPEQWNAYKDFLILVKDKGHFLRAFVKAETTSSMLTVCEALKTRAINNRDNTSWWQLFKLTFSNKKIFSILFTPLALGTVTAGVIVLIGGTIGLGLSFFIPGFLFLAGIVAKYGIEMRARKADIVEQLDYAELRVNQLSSELKRQVSILANDLPPPKSNDYHPSPIMTSTTNSPRELTATPAPIPENDYETLTTQLGARV